METKYENLSCRSHKQGPMDKVLQEAGEEDLQQKVSHQSLFVCIGIQIKENEPQWTSKKGPSKKKYVYTMCTNFHH